jgi:hypothetical protein
MLSTDRELSWRLSSLSERCPRMAKKKEAARR